MLIKKRKVETETEIIVLTYNKLETTKKFISLLYENTPQNFGLIIVDNNSTDKTREYLKGLDYLNLSLVFNDKNAGIVAGRNLGYLASRNLINSSSYFVFLDNDQFVRKNWLNSYFLLINKGYDVIGVEAWQMRKDFYPFRRIKSTSENFNYIGCGGKMIKDEVIDKIGLFDERFFIYFEDPDYSFRCNDSGYKLGWNNFPAIDHQKHNLRLDGERKKYFMESWKKFGEKWKNHKLPIFNMEK